MRSWISLGNVAAIRAPVFVHWSVLLVTAVLGFFALNSPVYAALAIACYLAMIAIHELGHALVARRLGYDVLAIRITPVHGQCECEAPDSEWHGVLIAWGGVAAQLCIALPVLTFAGFAGGRDIGYLGPVVAFLGYVNLLLALVNLAPSPGLDGAIAWRIVPLLWRRRKPKRAPRRALRSVAKRR